LSYALLPLAAFDDWASVARAWLARRGELELAIDGAGRMLFPVIDYTTGTNSSQLVAWTAASGRSSVPFSQSVSTRGEVVVVGGNRLLVRSYTGVFDVALSSTFTSSTMTHSSVELSGSSVGAIAWSVAQSRPVLVHAHGSALELITPNAAAFWTYTQLGNTSGVSAGVAVHPTTGEATVCYQNAGRIMFQCGCGARAPPSQRRPHRRLQLLGRWFGAHGAHRLSH